MLQTFPNGGPSSTALDVVMRDWSTVHVRQVDRGDEDELYWFLTDLS